MANRYLGKLGGTGSTSGIDFEDPEVRTALLTKLGVEPPKPKANFLERVTSFLSAFEGGNAVYDLLKSGDPLKAVGTYVGDVAGGLVGAFTGDVNTEKKTFSDVLGLVGVDDPIVKGVGGFVGDFLLDPTTYIGLGEIGKVTKFGKKLTATGLKVAKNAEVSAMKEILESVGKFAEKLGGDELTKVFSQTLKNGSEETLQALEKFVEKKGVKLTGPINQFNKHEIVLAFAEQRVNKVQRAVGGGLFKEATLEAKLGSDVTEAMFAKPGIYLDIPFTGIQKSIKELPEPALNAFRAVFNPTELALRYAPKVPVLGDALTKLNEGVIGGAKNLLGKTFDTLYDFRGGTLEVGIAQKRLREMITNIANIEGGERTKFIEKLQQVVDDPSLLGDLTKNLSPMQNKEFAKFFRDTDWAVDNMSFKLLGFDLFDKSAEEKLQQFTRVLDRGEDIEMATKLYEDFDPKALFEAQKTATDLKGMNTLSGLQAVKDLMKKDIDEFHRSAAPPMLRRFKETIRDFEGKSGFKTAMEKIKKIDSRKVTRADLEELVNSTGSKELKAALQKRLNDYEGLKGKYIKSFGSIVLNEDNALAKIAIELQSEAIDERAILAALDLPNIEGGVFRKVLGKYEGDEFIKATEDAIKVPNANSAVNIDKMFSKRQTIEFHKVGVEEGHIAYAIDEVRREGGKIKDWDVLTGAEKNAVRKEVANRIYEARVKVAAAKTYYSHGEWIKTGTLQSTGEKISLDTADKALKTEVEQKVAEGWIEPRNTGKLFKGYIMPPEVAKGLENTYKVFFNDEATQGWLKGYDKIQSWWKASVTVFFPGFHVRNGLSNGFSNYMVGVRNFKAYTHDAHSVQKYMNALVNPKATAKELEEMGGQFIGNYTVADVLDMAQKNGVVGQGEFFNEISAPLERMRPGASKNPITLALDRGTKVGNFVESNARLALFTDQLKKGNGVVDSANMVKKVLFDYADLTATEKNWFRRVIPFYTWQRKNAEFMARYATANPGKFGGILKGFRDIQDMFTSADQEDINALPSWARDGLSVVTGGVSEGILNSTTGFGTPVEATMDFFASVLGEKEATNILSSTSPIIRGFIETRTGVSLFTGKKLEEDDSGRQFKNLAPFLKDAIGYREIIHKKKDGTEWVEYKVDPSTKFTLNLFLGRVTSEAAKFSTMTQDFSPSALANFFSGMKTYEFDVDQEKLNREKEAAREMLKYLEGKDLAASYNQQFLTEKAKEKLNE